MTRDELAAQVAAIEIRRIGQQLIDRALAHYVAELRELAVAARELPKGHVYRFSIAVELREARREQRRQRGRSSLADRLYMREPTFAGLAADAS